jgi:hypothetical protein
VSEEDDENSAKDSHSACEKTAGFVVTAHHKVSGATNERNALRLVDFILFSIGALLCP